MKIPVSFEDLSRELMRRLRGKRSQGAFSKALGFDSNTAYAWETGRRFPESSTFFLAAERAGLDLRPRLSAFFKDAPAALASVRLGSPRGAHAVVSYLAGPSPKSELARRLAVDRTTLARWLAGKTEPRLPDLLRLVDSATQRLLNFVEIFADPSSLASTRSAYRHLRAQQKLAYELPWSHAILRALELEEYAASRHVPGLLSTRLGLTLEEEERYLKELARAGQIRWTGERWEIEQVLAVDTRQDPEKNQKLKAHWAKVGLERLQSGPSSEALFSFNLFAISEEAFQQVRKLHLEYYDQVRAIIDRSPQSERVVLMNLQLVPLDGATKEGGAGRCTAR